MVSPLVHAHVQALEELSEAVTPIVRAGTRGHLIDVKRVSSVNVEKMHVDGNLRRSGRPVQLRMRHITNHYDWEVWRHSNYLCGQLR